MADQKAVEKEDTEDERKRMVKIILNEIFPIPSNASDVERTYLLLKQSYTTTNCGLDHLDLSQLQKFLADFRNFKNIKNKE